jgi:tryptophan synthase alpha chain
MNRYKTVFTKLRNNHEAAFIPFAVAGDPDLAVSERILKAYIDAGADVLEIGYPFSDPIADGPVNQRGAQRAIAAGISPRKFFSLIKRIRAWNTDVPIGLLLYANTVNHLGYDTFCKEAADAGIDSLLIADMPPEEYDSVGGVMDSVGLSKVFIVSELTPSDRMRMICSEVTGFVYVVSRLGTTGTSTSLSESVAETLSKLKKVTDAPLAVGFGISKPSHVHDVVAAGADGVIVGSALVKIIEKYCSEPDTLVKKLKTSVHAYKKATQWRQP